MVSKSYERSLSQGSRQPLVQQKTYEPIGRNNSLTHYQYNPLPIPQFLPVILCVKSKYNFEWRRFSVPFPDGKPPSYTEFRSVVEKLHSLYNIHFTICYTSSAGDLLPITNDENFRKSFESATPTLRLLIQRKGESWEEKYGYGTDSIDRHRRCWTMLILPSVSRLSKRNYSISNPEDFRKVSSILDVDLIPRVHRRVRLCKYGTDRPLGFYIKDGKSVRITSQGVVRVQGIFISRLVEGGLAASTGLLAANDEVLEVNGIQVQGKTLDQVTDMMIANAQNLIITVKPANQRNTLQRGTHVRNTAWSKVPDSTTDAEHLPLGVGELRSTERKKQSYSAGENSDNDVVIDYTRQSSTAAVMPVSSDISLSLENKHCG